ncbi:hypothetical protein [Thermus igniterrae]|jgi:hypothetical protein|uniref:hypothetical protein n=1 Tax=Thermus igniterrae TaxID=88189 RepID=UPI000378605F|nr:hypothetical protein [Thermus igniterrae]
MKRQFWLLALILSACSFPFNYSINLLDYLEVEGTFQVGAGGIDPNPKDVGPVQVSWNPDPRVSLSGATLEFRVCFTSQTSGAAFSGTLAYTAYLGAQGGSGLFVPANKVAEGTRNISGLGSGSVCVEGQANLTPAQLQAIQSGNFYVGARISGTAQSAQEAIIRYRGEVFRLNLSGSVRPF